MNDFDESFGFGPSIFDQGVDAEVPAAMAHNPMTSQLRSDFPWAQPQQETTGQPHEGPRTAFTPGLPANPEYLCCVDGPCRHYAERLVELDAVGAQVLTKVERVCLGFGQPDSLFEGTCFACTKYAPKVWTLKTLRRAIIIAHRVGKARRRLGRRESNLRERVVEILYNFVKGDAPELPRDV